MVEEELHLILFLFTHVVGIYKFVHDMTIMMMVMMMVWRKWSGSLEDELVEDEDEGGEEEEDDAEEEEEVGLVVPDELEPPGQRAVLREVALHLDHLLEARALHRLVDPRHPLLRLAVVMVVMMVMVVLLALLQRRR